MLKTIMDDLPIHDLTMSIEVDGKTYKRYMSLTTLGEINSVVNTMANELKIVAAVVPERREPNV